MRKLACLALALSLAMAFWGLGSGGAAAADIQVVLDGQNINDRFEVQPMVIDSNILVPLRAIFEAMGASVVWEQDTMTALAYKDDISVVLPLGSTSPTVNSVIWTLPVPAQAIDGHTLAPLRFVGEAFGGTATWDGANQTAIISSSGGPADLPGAQFSATAVTASFAPVECVIDLAVDANTTSYDSVPLNVGGNGSIDASGSAETWVSITSNSFLFNLIMGEQEKTMDGCPFSELIYGPAAQGEELASALDLSEDAGSYYLTGRGDEFPPSVYELLNNVMEGVSFESASGDFVITVGKADLLVSQVYISSFTAHGSSQVYGDVQLSGSGSLDYSY